MKQTIILLTLFLFLCNHGSAQEKLSLTLGQAQEYALDHNRTLKNASLDIQKAEASRWSTLSTMLPQVNGAVDYANMMGYKLTMMGFDIAMPPYATIGVTTSVSLSAAQIIGVKMQNLAARMAEISRKQTEQEVANQVKTLYFSALIMEETGVLLDSNLANLQKLLAHTENSVRVGILTQTDADQLAVQIVTVENTVSSVKRSLEMIYNALRLQLGIGVDTQVELTQSLEELVNVDNAASLLNVQFSPDNNYNFQLLKSSVDLSRVQMNLKKWAYAPSITAYHSYTKKEYFSDEQTMNMTPPNIIGVSLTVPIFSSARRYADVKVAQYDYEKQLNTLSDAQEGLIVQHRQLCFNLRSALETYEMQKQNIEVNQRIFEDISRKFEMGMASSLELTNAGTSLIGAQSSYVQTLLDLLSAQIALEELLQNVN
ncbi:MAG: TolC family protein [Bacteroidales bacterium]|jgi:outer membrane protein TolC|nr:TolC family protein [Bacteroidales bacterium]